MNTKTTLLIKTDKTVKAAAQKTAHEIGIPLATIMNAYLKKFAREKRLEFESPLVPNAKTAAQLRQSQKEFKEGKYFGPFSNLDEMFESLEK